MGIYSTRARELAGIMVLPMLVGCQGPSVTLTGGPLPTNSVPSSLQVPDHVERLAILYPKTYSRELLNAYIRLEGAAFQLKERRPRLRIVERFNLPRIVEEQRLQLGGSMSESGAVRLGRLLGADSVLWFQIDGPNERDRIYARLTGEMPPVLITSKLVSVESGEIMYHNVVSSHVTMGEPGWASFATSGELQPVVRAALERGVRQTIADLQHAFR